MVSNYSWEHLDKLRTGRYGEYFAKMALVRAGLDVYSPEVDDRAIDAIVRLPGHLGAKPRYLDLQVKAARVSKSGYIFLKKRLFPLRPNAFLAFVALTEGVEPDLYLIPASAWIDPKPPFASRDYVGKKSEPEWGLTVGPKTGVQLSHFRFDRVIERLISGAWPEEDKK